MINLPMHVTNYPYQWCVWSHVSGTIHLSQTCGAIGLTEQ
jgi:hypothetical protein